VPPPGHPKPPIFSQFLFNCRHFSTLLVSYPPLLLFPRPQFWSCVLNVRIDGGRCHCCSSPLRISSFHPIPPTLLLPQPPGVHHCTPLSPLPSYSPAEPQSAVPSRDLVVILKHPLFSSLLPLLSNFHPNLLPFAHQRPLAHPIRPVPPMALYPPLRYPSCVGASGCRCAAQPSNSSDFPPVSYHQSYVVQNFPRIFKPPFLPSSRRMRLLPLSFLVFLSTIIKPF